MARTLVTNRLTTGCWLYKDSSRVQTSYWRGRALRICSNSNCWIYTDRLIGKLGLEKHSFSLFLTTWKTLESAASSNVFHPWGSDDRRRSNSSSSESTSTDVFSVLVCEHPAVDAEVDVDVDELMLLKVVCSCLRWVVSDEFECYEM